MEEEVLLVVQEFRVYLVHHGDGLRHSPVLDGVADVDAVVHPGQLERRRQRGLTLELLRGLFEAL